MEILPEVVNTIGLVLDVLGVVIVFKFGWPQPTHETFYLLSAGEIDDPHISKREVLHKRVSVFGLICLVAGFGVQIVATWMV